MTTRPQLTTMRGPEASNMIRSLLKAQADKFKSIGLQPEDFQSSTEPTNFAGMIEERSLDLGDYLHKTEEEKI